MDQSLSESDISMSPSQLLERLQVLRQAQLLQRGKLHKQRLEYEDSTLSSSSITEIVSRFTDSTSYNTFLSLLQSTDDSPRQDRERIDLSQKLKSTDLVEGVAVLNLSQESEFIVNSPISSRVAASLDTSCEKTPINSANVSNKVLRKNIELEEMPILSPRKDFEALILEKLENDKSKPKEQLSVENKSNVITKKPFLRRGEGMHRFGLKKKDPVIQKTNSLPWKKRQNLNKSQGKVQEPGDITKKKDLKANSSPGPKQKINESSSRELSLENKQQSDKDNSKLSIPKIEIIKCNKVDRSKTENSSTSLNNLEETSENSYIKMNPNSRNQHPLLANKGKTWAAILTQEQDNFLKQLKQTNYYKNFVSPAKSVVSDISCDENLHKLRSEREFAEQNLFNLLEHKVSQEDFTMESSFLNKFLRRSNLECSGESTPLVLQKCLDNNPELLTIYPGPAKRKINDDTHSDAESCSEYTECTSSDSTCCSCNTVEESTPISNKLVESKNVDVRSKKAQTEEVGAKKSIQNKTDTVNDTLKANMAEMNEKLVATSELLKERLRELEDEINTFRKENGNLVKMREEIDSERQKFYEEKATFEQKFNEDKILAEYHLVEEKEKMEKQRQMYERYVREMRGRINKKDKDEVVNLKTEINNLKDEIRIKDAKSTSTIARLRNQIKIMEKEKKDLQGEVEKLKKENKRIQHSNEITRRLTNLKYLEQINKKLTHISKENPVDYNSNENVKYKAHEIERQSRSRHVQPLTKPIPRAKSVPNLNVTSRYAKYFSQRDSVSQLDRNKEHSFENVGDYNESDNEHDGDQNDSIITEDKHSYQDDASDDENNLEKLYLGKFKSSLSPSNRSSLNNSDSNPNIRSFFLSKSNSNTSLKKDVSPLQRSLSPNTEISSKYVMNRSKSPTSTKSDRVSSNIRPSYSSHISSTARSHSPVSTYVSHIPRSEGNHTERKSPEPISSRTTAAKTKLNPTEIIKPDGTKELRFPNGNVKYFSADGKYSKFVYYNGDIKENFYDEGRIRYYYGETRTYHTTQPDGLEILEFPDGQIEKRYKDGSSEIRLPNGSIRYHDPKNAHLREEWRFPDGTTFTISATGEKRVLFPNGQVEVHCKDHKRREFPDGSVKLLYNDGTSETRYATGRVRIKDKHGNLLMDSAPK